MVVTLGETIVVPATDRVPLQPPDVEHEVVLVDDQARVDDWPALMEAGDAEMETVGVDGGVVPEVLAKDTSSTVSVPLL